MHYLELSIYWSVITSDFITNRTIIPENITRDVFGQVIFEEESTRVEPVKLFQGEAIDAASTNLVESHRLRLSNVKILRQRQQIRLIPVTKVDYKWKDKFGSFFVAGFENYVHFPDSLPCPGSCCCDCTIN